MENSRFIKFIIPIFVLGFFIFNSSSVFAYEIEAHTFLTNEVIKFYNQNFPNQQISNELKNYLIDGSRREDDIPRWMNHFDDPVYNRGLTDSVLGTWEKSKDWAQDSNNQNSLIYKVPATIASILTAIQQGEISVLSSETEFTWQRAIKFYVNGEKEKAMFMLGHVLHLLEDASVPDHTRNDPHPGDSPYENWTAKFSLANPDPNLTNQLSNKKPIIIFDLNSYFDELSNYSNNNFYSKDTLGIGIYSLPSPDYFQILNDGRSYGMKNDKEFGDYPIIKAKGLLETDQPDELLNKPIIMYNYFFRLSTKSVQYGAGVINLFFQEVEKAKNDPNFAKLEDKSVFAKALETAKNLLAQIGNFFSGNSDGFQPAGEVSLDQSQNSSISGDQTSNITSQNIKQCSFNTPQSPSRQKIIINEVAWMGTVASANNEWIELKNISSETIDLTGWQIIDQAEQIKINLGLFKRTKLVAGGFILLERNEEAVPNISADLIYAGALSNTNEGLRLFDSQCSLIDEVLANPSWPTGDNQAKKTMERASDFSWYTSSIVGGTPKKENSQPVLVKKQELSINPPEETEEDDEEIALQQEQIQQATSSLQQTENFKQCSFSTNQISSHQNILINEIAWMGTANSANDEWIELKNISASEINLNRYQLIDKGEQIKINLGLLKETKIGPGGFILLERTDDNTVPNITADLIYVGALSNNNEGLRLFDNQCNLIDEVLANPDWPAGDNTSAQERKTIERDLNGFGWHTSSVVGGTPKASNSQPAISYSGGGGGGGDSTLGSGNTNQPVTVKILINEIQLASQLSTNDEFVELYNPNDTDIDLTGYYIQKKTKTASSFSTFVKTDLFQGKIIKSKSYFLITHPSSTFNYDVVTSYGVADNNTLVLKNPNGDIIDKVGWGEASDCENSCALNPVKDQSIQRKIHPSTSLGFIDTDNNGQDFEIQTCPSPKAQSRTCQLSQANQAPGAFFIYTPANPKVGDLISFNAASSTNSNNNIILYQWDFGDNTTVSTTNATTTHFYSATGNYPVQLIVFDNNNASSSTSSTLYVAPAAYSSSVNHILISEIMAGAGTNHSDEEFIEFYNPTNEQIDLTGYYLKRKNSSTATSTQTLVKKDVFQGKIIPTKGFFLITSPEYSATTTPDLNYSYSYRLAYDDEAVLLYNSNGVVDEVNYSTIEAGKSFERKAFAEGICISAQVEGEFLGNGCDIDDSAIDFEIRTIPNPQNSQNLPEPRNEPTAPKDFNIQYNVNAMELNFNWQPSQDYSGDNSTLIYKITDISQTSSTLSDIEATSTIAKIFINEVGRNYQFSIRAFDREGLGSATPTSSSTVPSFFSGLYFYQDPRDNSKNLIEAYYNEYPFIPDLFSQNKWKLLVFYLNKDAEKQLGIYESWQPNNLENLLAVKYKHCSSGSIIQRNSLILPDTNNRCDTSGGAYSQALSFNELEDNHFIIQTADLTSDARFDSANPPKNYLTVAFYDTYSTMPFDGRVPYFQLAAVDKTKYYFNQTPNHQPPQLTGQINLYFDKQNSRLNIDWPKAVDPDTLDSLLVYEIQYSSSTDWEVISNTTGTIKVVAPGDNLSISVRAKDDFNNYSDPPLTAQWSYPETTFYISHAEANNWSSFFGYKDGLNCATLNLQSITPESDFQFNKVVLKIKQTQANDSANLKLSIYQDNGSNQPNFESQLSSTNIADVFRIDGSQETTFSFDNPISVISNNKYWLVLEVASYIWLNSYDQWGRNQWQSAINDSNSYLLGEAGSVKSCGSSYSSFYTEVNNDWYMKIGLE